MQHHFENAGDVYKILAIKPARAVRHDDLSTPVPRRCKRGTDAERAANDLAVAFRTQVQEWKNTLLSGKAPGALKKHRTASNKLEREVVSEIFAAMKRITDFFERDRRHHLGDRRHRVPNQHPGAERCGGSNADRRTGPRLRGGGL